MKYIITIILAIAFLGTIPSVLHARGAGIEWDTLSQEVMELNRTGKYDRALVVAQKALQVAEQNVGPDHPDVATSLENLSALHLNTNRNAETKPMKQRALKIRAIKMSNGVRVKLNSP